MDFFRPNIEKSITLPSPPLRDEDEISRMKDIIRNRTAEDVQSIRNHDEVPFYALRKYCQENGLIFHENDPGQSDHISDSLGGLYLVWEPFSRKT